MQGVDLEARLWALSGDLPCRIIPNEDGAPYLQRYYLGESGGRVSLLHQFVRNDDVRGYHNHPWRNASSTILTGGYREHRAEQLVEGAPWSLWEEVHGVGSVRELDGSHFHRVQLLSDPVSGEPLPTWTLFSYVYGDVKPWGFIEQDAVGAWQFREHLYPECGNTKPADWWLTAPLGRDIRQRERWPQVATKFCPGCERSLSVALFAQVAGRPDGLAGYCRGCNTHAARASEQRRAAAESPSVLMTDLLKRK